MDEALRHSNACRELLDDERHVDAIAYCSAQRVEPPQYFPAIKSEETDERRGLETQVLADYGWWVKRLKIRAVREAEIIRIRQGLAAIKNV